MKIKKVLIAIIIIVVVILLFMIRYFVTSRADNTNVSTISFSSTDYDDPGSYQISESAVWKDDANALYTLDVNTIAKSNNNSKDVIIAIDLSGSMSQKKLDVLKKSVKSLVSGILNTSGNKVAIIGFKETGSSFVDFTTNATTINNAIDGFTAAGNTNFNYCYTKIADIMDSYTRTPGKIVTTLVITDGVPVKGIQKALYTLVKDEHPYLHIAGIQYEMGNKVSAALEAVTDVQYTASTKTINNMLLNATIDSDEFLQFDICVTINNDFTINSLDDVTVPFGTVELSVVNNTLKLDWNFDGQKTGISGQLQANLALKESIRGTKSSYSAVNGTDVIRQLAGTSAAMQSSVLTPTLTGTVAQTSYTITYDLSAKPSGCTASLNSTQHLANTVVELSKNLTCAGYVFKGWEVTQPSNLTVTKINDYTIIMPSSNITLAAKWAKPTVAKSLGEYYYIEFVNRQNSNSISVGDELAIGSEHFMVVSTNANDTVLLAKYNLYVGDIIDYDSANNTFTYVKTLSSSDEGYGLQNSTAKGREDNVSRFIAVVPFTGTKYWTDTNLNLLSKYATGGASFSGNPYPYVYEGEMTTPIQNDYTSGYGIAQDNNYTIAFYVEPYINLLKTLGAPDDLDGGLLTAEEAITLGCSVSNQNCNNAPSWLYNSTYWTGSAYNSGRAWYIYSTGIEFKGGWYHDGLLGVRPKITIATSDIPS